MCSVMPRSYVWIFGLLALFCQVGYGGQPNIYDEYSLIRLIPSNEQQLNALVHFEDPDGQVEVLKKSRDLHDSHDILVPPHRLEAIQRFSDHHGIVIQVKDQNYGRSIQADSTVVSSRNTFARRVTQGFNIFGYNSYSDIQNFVNKLEANYPGLVQLEELGQSYQGRSMNLVKISTNPMANNPVIFVDAGIHAREWVAPAMALYLIHRLVNDPKARQYELDGVDWYILPVVNPDGYEYTRSSSSNRLWRKTRSKTNQNCYGVDGNRNYGYKWGVSGVSKNPCDKETYAGPQPFSEPETQMVRNVMAKYQKDIKLYVSLHAYGQYLVYPWGYTGDFLPNEWRKLETMAKRVSHAVEAAGGRPFKVMSAGKWYPAAGGSDDFAFGAMGIPYSYTMELTDGYEFRYPEKYLRKVLPQFYEGFIMFGKQIKAEFGVFRSSRESFGDIERPEEESSDEPSPEMK